MNLHNLDTNLCKIEHIEVDTDFYYHDIFEEFINMMNISQDARNVLNILIRDIGKPINYDPINNLSVDDLLLEIATRIKKGIIDPEIFEQQLIEMKTGMCPQGRTIRLYSILFASNTLL